MKSIDERVESIGRGLVRLGVPTQWCMHVAWGMVTRLQRALWKDTTDLIGSPEDLEDVIGWTGPPRAAAVLFVRSGLVADAGSNTLAYVRATRDIPDYLRQAWKRADRESYNQAMNRFDGVPEPLVEIEPPTARLPKAEVDPEPDAGEDAMGQLFPDMGTPGVAKVNGTPGHGEAVGHWLRRYKKKYGRSYLFRPKDGAIIKRLLKQASADDIKAAMNEYLRCDDPFWFGHELDGLSSKWNRWSNGQTRTRLGKDGEITEELGVRRL